MEWLRCLHGHGLCPLDGLYFYEQVSGSGNWHLIVRPQRMPGLESGWTVAPSPKKSKYAVNSIHCSTCGIKVGMESPVGPNEELLLCFDYKMAVLQNNSPPSKWKSARSCFPSIETWTGKKILLSSSHEQYPLLAPTPADFMKLDMSTLTCTTPRNYQIELFVRAALQNSLIFLPTGTGKTLVAVMVVKFLKQLNRGKLAIFLADRIPLVHQQAKVLAKEGELTVKVITGENSSVITNSTELDNICSKFEVLALTAQVFLNLLLKGFPVERCCCILFDEAHHAVGGHTYAKILQNLSLCEFGLRPRILGLTASPAGEATHGTTDRKVDELCEMYCSASVLMPVLWAGELETTSCEAETAYSYVCCTSAERKLQHDLWEYFYFLWDKLYAGFSEATRTVSGCPENLRSFIRERPQSDWTPTSRKLLENLFRSFCTDQERRVSSALMERMSEILLLIDESTVYGVSRVKKQLTLKCWRSQEVGDGRFLEELLTPSNSDTYSETVSSRVEALLKEVRLAIADNPTSRILVFVQTRYTARALEHTLEQVADIKKLRPSRLVGHSGFDGMRWEEEQKPMLDRFRSGIVQLLIATSVLEEGIDVPSCNLVIRFDGMGSFTRTVQSRGRARLRNSRFVVLLTREEIEKARKIHCMESNMLNVVRRKFSLLSTSTTSVVNHLVNQKQLVCRPVGASSDSCIEENVVEHSEDGRLSEQSYIVKLKFHSKWLTESLLTAALRQHAKVLKCDMVCSLVYLGCFPGQDATSSYRSICTKSIPQLLEQSSGEHVWFQKCSKEISAPVDSDLTGSKKLRLLGVFAGIFKDPSTFVQVYSPELGRPQHPHAKVSEGPSICWDSQEDFLCLHVPEETVVIEFTPAAIDGWVLLHHDSEYATHRLYVPLRLAPKVYSPSADTMRQRLGADVDSHNRPKAWLLNVLKDCPVFELLITSTGKQEKFFVELVEFFESHGILIYDSKVEDICSLDNSNDEGSDKVQSEEEVQGERDCAPDGILTFTIRQKLLHTVMLGEHFTPGPQVRLSTHFCTSFLLECIFSQHAGKLPRILVPDQFYEILYGQEQDVQERSLLAMMASVTWFCDPVVLLQQAVQKVLPSTRVHQLAPTSQVSVRQATVTPSRVIFYEPLMMKGSRLLRHFDAENFLKVSFRDENMGFIPGNEPRLISRVYGILEKGIRVAGRLYTFLGCSSSMLRSHSCWMTSLNPSEVRSWLGDFQEIRCVGEYMARVGLGMAASDPTITLEDRVVQDPIPDVVRNNFCFSDGVGKISRVSLKRVLEYLRPRDIQWFNTVTAIQIRVAGYKGVVALDPALRSEDTQCLLRESMRKFPSPHRQLEVLNTATSLPAYLNRQSIVLLSCLGVQDSIFEGLQELQLQELLKLFAEDQSEKAITRNCQALRLQSVFGAGIYIHSEPFFQHILSAIYFQKVQRLVTKTHIFVPDGRLLMGVLDETNSLNYGEIFVQLVDTSTSWEPRIISGRCVTYKNPCFHPGDIRVLCARDIRELRHLVNCIVFPAKGPRPHTDEMSGSDLDGDLYTVIWMPGLIPSRTHEPMSYDPGPPLEVPEVRESDMFEFFVKTVKSAELGLIANSHLALADSKPDGALDRDCIELAKLHARAVDFPKTGQQVDVRRDLVPTQLPDFMEKHKRPSYTSTKVLGRLYRRAKCLFGDDLKRQVNVRLKPDQLLVLDSYPDCIDEAEDAYKQYCTLIRGLMQCYGVKQEAEIVTGCIVSMHDHLTPEIVQWTEVVKQQFKELVQTFRDRFFASVSSPEQRYNLASAWYMAAYSDEYEETRCLSFPWLVSEVLAVIKHNKLSQGVVFIRDGTNHGHSLEESVYHSMKADFIEQYPSKFASLVDRGNLLEKVETCVKALHTNASVKMFGSSSTYLFEPSVSDVDLCVKIENLCSMRRSPKSQIELLDGILTCLQQDFPGTYAIRDARVPILKNDSGSLAFDLTVDDAGLRKSGMVLKRISLYPGLLLALTVVVKWARNVGLIASQSGGQFTAFSITWLFIQFCSEKGYVQSIIDSGDIKSSPSLLLSVVEEVLDPVPSAQMRFVGGELPSEILLNFFQHYADLSVNSLPGATSMSTLRIPDPLGESIYPCVELDGEKYTLFRNRCLQAWHALTRTRNVKSLYFLGERHVCLRLSRFQSSVIRGAEEYYAKRLSSLAGGKARVRISCHGKSSGKTYQSRRQVFHVDIQGDPAAVHIVEKELQELNSGQRWLPTYRQGFYVKGATLLLFGGSLSEQDRVGFVRYSGECHLKHVSCGLHLPVLVARIGGPTWMTHALSRLRAAVWRQRQYLLSPDANSFAPTPPVHALIRFGTLYVTNVPFDLRERQSIASVSVADLEEIVVRGKRHMPLQNIAQHGDQSSSEPRARYSSSLASDYSDAEEDCATDTDHNSHIRVKGSTTRRKKFRQQACASQSLFPHVHGSLEPLLTTLPIDGFTKQDQDSEKYLVTLFTPKEWRIRLSSHLEFLSLSRRPVRWLCGSLLFQNEDPEPPLVAHGHHQQRRPNCVRFHIGTKRQIIHDSELRTKAVQNAVLEFTPLSAQAIRVGSAFRGEVAFVRRVKKERWVSTEAGLCVKILSVTEWEGWNQDSNSFKSHKSRQEVEVHMLDANAHLRGSERACEEFIQRFWDSALRFKESIFL